MAFGEFVRGAGEALLDVLFGVTATAQSILELLHRRRHDEHDDGRGVLGEDLFGALDFDL